MAAGSTDSTADERYSRHRLAPGFDQSALVSRPLFRFSLGTTGADPVGDHLGRLAAAMGVERQTVAAAAPQRASVRAAARSMLLNPRVKIDLVSLELGVALARAEVAAGRPPFVVISLPPDPASAVEHGAALAARLPGVAVRFVARQRGVVVLGDQAEPVARRGAALGAGEDGALAGVHGVEAAAHLLGDFLAVAGAWSDRGGAPMPRAPEIEVFRACAGAVPPEPRPLRLLLVGAGGALAHGFLEATLADPFLRAALAGGRLSLVDPDQYDGSNLGRQTLAEGPHRLGQPKAAVTAAVLRERWGGGAPELLPIVDRFDPRLLDEHRPHAVGLFADNLAARALAARALSARPGSLILNAGTEFTLGQARAVAVGARGLCLDCGPEALAEAAEEERRQEASRASCAQEVTPSNVLTNALTGALSARQLARYLAGEGVEPRQRWVNWRLPARTAAGPVLPACACHEGAGRAP